MSKGGRKPGLACKDDIEGFFITSSEGEFIFAQGHFNIDAVPFNLVDFDDFTCRCWVCHRAFENGVLVRVRMNLHDRICTAIKLHCGERRILRRDRGCERWKHKQGHDERSGEGLAKASHVVAVGTLSHQCDGQSYPNLWTLSNA